jgi:hypothetical protein
MLSASSLDITRLHPFVVVRHGIFRLMSKSLNATEDLLVSRSRGSSSVVQVFY